MMFKLRSFYIFAIFILYISVDESSSAKVNSWRRSDITAQRCDNMLNLKISRLERITQTLQDTVSKLLSKNCTAKDATPPEKEKPSPKSLPTEQQTNKALDTRDYDEHLNSLKTYSSPEKLPKSCAETNISTTLKEGKYVLHVPNSNLQPFYAFCLYDKNKKQAWTVIQRRTDGSQNFYRNWTEYKQGFGDVSGEHWLGLERIHQMTKDKPHDLWILLINSDGKKYYNIFSDFSVDSERKGYKLTARRRTGNAGDALTQHNKLRFLTYDTDTENGCAKFFGSGWWYKDCYHCNLNGIYVSSPKGHIYRGVKWNTEFMRQPKYVHMAIREW